MAKFLFSHKNKGLLYIGITFNLSLLIYYKYTCFLLREFNELFSSDLFIPNIILPLAISFYTFQQITFIVDNYQNKKDKYPHIIDYLLYIIFFPQLIAGPIVHFKDVKEQFHSTIFGKIILNNFNIGLTIFIIGLSKKCLLADNLAEYVNPVFSAAETGVQVSLLEAWIASISYTLQLYFDFSGYSDMAIGLGYLFNIVLPINFKSPLLALNIIEFWRRWHITLSNFLKDYLYIPLGGNRKGKARRYQNLMITMTLGGIWHGAGWTFLIWGILHGIYLSINHFWQFIIKDKKTPKLISWLFTFIAIVFAFMIFRAKNIVAAVDLTKSMLGFHSLIPALGQLEKLLPFASVGPDVGPTKVILIWLPIAIITMFFGKRSDIIQKEQLNKKKISILLIISISLLLIMSVLSLDKPSEFLYFQF